MKKFLAQIKREKDILEHSNEEELEVKIAKIKKRIEKESLDDIAAEWFALVQEISFRKIGLRHFNTQLLAGFFLNQGKIVEMKTGEGKTLASTLPVALNALTKKGVHVVTVNDYLAERDKKWMGKIFNGLGLTVGLVKSTSSLEEKSRSYQSDITYVTNSELVFDYLRDSSSYNVNELVQRPFNYCLIDEIDSVLIDEARTPLILSTFAGTTDVNKLYLSKALAEILKKDIDFQIDERRREINLTEEGYEEATQRLGKTSLYDPEDPWILQILNALKAKHIFKLNKDYIVLKGKIVIVDEFTGRVMEDRRWSSGIHEAIEIKECVDIGGGTKTKSSITYQNFFTLYPKLSGMTGTAKTTEKEFKDIYNLEVLELPTAKPMIRKDLPDLVYQTELAKWKAVLNQSKKCFETGQPLLIGTASVEKSEFLSDLFKTSKIPHQVLNAKPENIIRESEIVAQAGKRYGITIATNMAGRGTDIILGGNPLFEIKQKLVNFLLGKEKNENKEIQELLDQVSNDYELTKTDRNIKKDIQNLPYSLEIAKKSLKDLYNYLYKDVYKIWEEENKKVKELGGLFVLGTERHETRRIDNQLRGRAGRQGDPGISQFFVSLDDDLIKIFGGSSISKWVEYLIQDKDVPLESDLLSKSLENAQKKVELYNYELRKNVFQYDDILNNQRKRVFKARNDILCKNIYEKFFLRYSESLFRDEIKAQRNGEIEIFNYELEEQFGDYATFSRKQKKYRKQKLDFSKEIWVGYDLRLAESNVYEKALLKKSRSTLLLSVIDLYWTEHLERMSYIRETINWRSYGQQNPLMEYNTEAVESFESMLKQIRKDMLYYFLNDSLTE